MATSHRNLLLQTQRVQVHRHARLQNLSDLQGKDLLLLSRHQCPVNLDKLQSHEFGLGNT